jgi:hypothetical protein
VKGFFSMRRVVGVGASLGMVGAALLSSPAPSSAALSTAGCVFAGATANAVPGVKTVGGSGTYSFAGSATCVLNGKTEASSISSSGTYKSIVCGTGSAAGSASIAGNKGDSASGSLSITFVGGQGTLVAHVSIDGKPPITVTGPVSIAPKTGNCVTPVTQFTVSALIAG